MRCFLNLKKNLFKKIKIHTVANKINSELVTCRYQWYFGFPVYYFPSESASVYIYILLKYKNKFRQKIIQYLAPIPLINSV